MLVQILQYSVVQILQYLQYVWYSLSLQLCLFHSSVFHLSLSFLFTAFFPL